MLRAVYSRLACLCSSGVDKVPFDDEVEVPIGMWARPFRATRHSSSVHCYMRQLVFLVDCSVFMLSSESDGLMMRSSAREAICVPFCRPGSYRLAGNGPLWSSIVTAQVRMHSQRNMLRFSIADAEDTCVWLMCSYN